MFFAINTVQTILYSLTFIALIAATVATAIFLNRMNNKKNKEFLDEFAEKENFNIIPVNDERLKSIHEKITPANNENIMFSYFKRDDDRDTCLLCFTRQVGITGYFRHYFQLSTLYKDSVNLKDCRIIPLEHVSAGNPGNVNLVSPLTEFDNNFVLIAGEDRSVQYDLSKEIQQLIIRYFVETGLKPVGFYISRDGIAVNIKPPGDQSKMQDLLDFGKQLVEILEEYGIGSA